jgi:hypothetical protein
VRIGAGSGIYPFVVGVSNHLQKVRVQVWLPLEIEDQVKQFPVNFIDGLPEKILLQHAGRPGELTKTTGALGAAKVAAGGWLK